MANNITIKNENIRVGDSVKVHYVFSEKGKKKRQVFAGILIGVRGNGNNKMFTVRKMTKSKIGVERIYPAISPNIEKVEVVKRSTNTKAKIGYIRKRSEREIRERLYS